MEEENTQSEKENVTIRPELITLPDTTTEFNINQRVKLLDSKAIAEACGVKLQAWLRGSASAATQKTAAAAFCCINFGNYTEKQVTSIAKLKETYPNILVPKVGTKINICDGSYLWNTGKDDLATAGFLYQLLTTQYPLTTLFANGCDCDRQVVEEDKCCDYAGVYAGLGLAAAIVFERIEMGKKTRGDDNKHGLALALVLLIILMLIITNIGTTISAFWLLLLGAVIFIGMSLIQGKFMKQYALNGRPRFSDFSAETSELQVEQSFFTQRDSTANVAF